MCFLSIEDTLINTKKIELACLTWLSGNFKNIKQLVQHSINQLVLDVIVVKFVLANENIMEPKFNKSKPEYFHYP